MSARAILVLLCLCGAFESARAQQGIVATSDQLTQTSAQTSQALPHLKVETPDQHNYTLKYNILPNSKNVEAAWIEIWDGPQLLLRQSVAVSDSGNMRWVDTSESTPNELFIALLDPDATRRFICFDDCTPEDSFQVPLSAEVVAGLGPGGDYPSPKLQRQTARIVAESQGQELLVSAIYLAPESRVLVAELDPEKHNYKALQYLPVEHVDLRHLKVWLPDNLLLSPRVLVLDVVPPEEGEADSEPVFDGNDHWRPRNSDYASVLVVCKESPHLDRLEPDELRADAADNDIARVGNRGFDESSDDAVPEEDRGLLKMHGSGFNTQSRVVLGDDPLRSRNVESEFVSSHEMRIWLRPSQLKDRAGETIPLWVINDKEGCGISEKRAFRVLPTEKNPLPVPTGWITSINPYPVVLMNEESPTEMELVIKGEDFRPDDKVMAATLGNMKYKNLKTEFISPEQLRAWLPRDRWRVHRLSFRFVIRTAAGERRIELREPQ